MPSKVWDEITYPFPNLKGATVEVWFNGAIVDIWMSYFPLHIIVDVITYPWLE